MAEAKDEAGGWALEGCTCPPLFDHRRFLHHIGCPLKDRDQALSAPTAESGKDSAPPGSDVTPNSGGPVHVQGVITTTGGGGAVEPVAEAPERVTSQQAFGIVLGLDGERFEILNRYIAQQEQSEREVAGLRESLDKYRNRKRELDQELASKLDDIEQLRTQLTAAERKAEGLRNECEDLRGGLELAEQALQAASGWLVALRGALASTEPAGVEACKADEAQGIHPHLYTHARGDAACVRCGHHWFDRFKQPCKADPTPTETEAPARFRVGQRVKIVGFDSSKIPPSCVNQFALVLYMPDPQADVPGCTVAMEKTIGDYDAGEQWWVDFSELEPADPAPPKPGEVVTRDIRIGDILAYQGQRSRVIGTEGYEGAIRSVCVEPAPFTGWVPADELEREGGGKS